MKDNFPYEKMHEKQTKLYSDHKKKYDEAVCAHSSQEAIKVIKAKVAELEQL